MGALPPNARATRWVALDPTGYLRDGARVIVLRQRAVIALVVFLGGSGSAWAQPKSAEPAKPEAARPEAAKAEPAKPVATVDAAAKPEVAEPGAAKPDEEPAWQKTPATRRGGFTGGFTIGGALGTGAGYPNDVKKIGREAFYTETGVAAGGIGMVWAGAALTDWFNFSLGLGMATLLTDTTERTAVTLAFRVEAFPLFTLGDRWRDLGVMIETGTGTDSIVSNDDQEVILAEGSAPSRLAIGAFFEAFRPWKLAIGPYVSYGYSFGETIRAGEVALGLRTVIYTKSP